MKRKILYSVYEPKNIPEMSDEEVQEALESGTDTVIIGVGSIESHGGHIPLGCDNFQVSEFCKRTVVKLTKQGYKALAGPVIPFGMSSYYKNIPGTITISSATLKAVIKEVCMSLEHQGFKKIALVLGHGGDYTSMMDAAQELVDETEIKVMVLNWVPVMQARYSEFSDCPGPDEHGGEINTSKLMAVVPELIQMHRAPKAYIPSANVEILPSSQMIGGLTDEKHDLPFAYSPLLGGGVWIPLKDFVSEAGGSKIIGDPTLATPEKGEIVIEIITEWLKEVIISNWGN